MTSKQLTLMKEKVCIVSIYPTECLYKIIKAISNARMVITSMEILPDLIECSDMESDDEGALQFNGTAKTDTEDMGAEAKALIELYRGGREVYNMDQMGIRSGQVGAVETGCK